MLKIGKWLLIYSKYTFNQWSFSDKSVDKVDISRIIRSHYYCSLIYYTNSNLTSFGSRWKLVDQPFLSLWPGKMYKCPVYIIHKYVINNLYYGMIELHTKFRKYIIQCHSRWYIKISWLIIYGEQSFRIY